jgi:hypothetical protein
MTAQQIVEARGVVLESSDSPTGFVLQIITPGIGSSGYYSAEVLEAAVTDNVFPKGTHLYIDHPSQTEAQDRPERSIRDLAGSTTGDAVWNPITQAVESACKVYPRNAWIKEVAEDIGMSIRASADVSEGVIEGRKMPIIEKLVEAYSVDFVTRAGRGGKVLAAIESCRESLGERVSGDSATESGAGVADLPLVTAGGQSSESEETPVPPVQESAEVAEATRRIEAAEARATAAEAERDQLRAQLAERDNRDAALAKVTARLGARLDHLPAVKARVIGEATRTLPLKDGVLDVAALESATDKAVEDETAYLKAALGNGAVSGHGQTAPLPTVDDHKTAEEARARVPFTRPTVRN